MGTKGRVDINSKTGVCMFAYNNKEIDYGKLAIIAAIHVKANMKHNSTALICDNYTAHNMEERFDSKLVNFAFDYIIIDNIKLSDGNVRVHHDSPYYTFKAPFKNQNKHQIFNYSPFDKTLLIDIDYFICNNNLDCVFEMDAPLSMYDRALNLEFRLPHIDEQRLRISGIDMWWSTVIYFDKSDFCEMFFDLWAQVRDNKDFYKFRYGFPGHLYRTDYAVSIAIHILNGMVNNDGLIQPLPGEFMRFMDQKDNIVEVQEKNKLLFLVNNRRETWKDLLVQCTNENVHLMNKKAIERHADKFMEIYYGK